MILRGDCLALLRDMPDESVDAVVTDPPYGLSKEPDMADVLRHWLAGDDYTHTSSGFMGKAWDSFVPGPAVWRECLRVVKPGGHLVAFSSTRTEHLLGVALALAGWERRDTGAWCYWSGFPKSLDVSKAIDRQRDDGPEIRTLCRWLRERLDAHPEHTVRTVAERFGFHSRMVEHWAARDTDSQPTVPTLEQWAALRDLLAFGPEMDALVWRLNGRKGEPGEAWWEREVVGSKWVPDGTRCRPGFAGATFGGDSSSAEVAITAGATPDAIRWSGYGTALKPSIEPWLLCRKPLRESSIARQVLATGTGALNIDGCRFGYGDPAWPGPNDGPEVINGRSGGQSEWNDWQGPAVAREIGETFAAHDLGRWPANLYACPKASRSERERGCDDLPPRAGFEAVDREEGSAGLDNPRAGAGRTADRVRNFHPTVKPVRLMRWLCRLLTPPGGLVVDPFVGSGTTAIAAVLEGFRVVGCELDPHFADIAEARLAHAHRWPASWADTTPGAAYEASEEIEVLERAGQARLFGGAP